MSLKKIALGGVKSTGASVAVVSGLQIAHLLVLARFLAPSDFGLMAMAMVAMGVAVLVAEMGLSSAIIQRQSVSNDVLSSLYWLNVLSGAFIFIIVVSSANLIANAFAEPRVTQILRWLSLSFLIAPLGQPYRAILEKNLQFGSVAKAEVSATAIGAASAIVMAYMGFGVMALVAGYLVTTSTLAVVFCLIGRRTWKPRLRLNLHETKDYLQFGAHLVGQRSINYISGNVDYVVVGGLLGAQALGIYSMAYRLVNLPSSHLNSVLSRVCFPIYSKLQDKPQKLKEGYLRIQEYSTTISVPFLFMLGASAPVMVPAIFGELWMPMVMPLQILSIVGLARAIASTVGPLLLAKGRPDLGLKWSLLVVTIQAPSVYFGARLGGMEGVALAFALAQIVVLILNYFILVRILIGPCFKAYIATAWPALSFGSVLAIVVYGIGARMDALPLFAVFFVQLVAGSLVYFVLVWIFRRTFFRELRVLIFG